MSRLNELIQEYCPDGVEYKKLSDVSLKITDGMHNLPKNTMSNGDYPIISAQNVNDGKIDINSSKYVSKEIYEQENKRTDIHAGDVLLTIVGAIGRTAVVKSDIHVLAQRSLCVIHPDCKQINSSFLKYVLDSSPLQEYMLSNAHGAAQKGIYLDQVSKLKLPIPPLPVQQEIVRILDSFSSLEQELEQELEQRKKQYEYYRDDLLENAKVLASKSLDEVFDIVDYRGKTPKKTESGIFLVTAKNIRKGFIDYDASKEYIASDDYDEVMHRGKPKTGDILITTEAPCGNVALVDREDIALAQRVIKFRPKDINEVDNVYALQYFLGKQFQTELARKSTGGTVKGIKGSKLAKMKILLPSIEDQKKVADILTKFSEYSTSLTSGLPSEISLRKKQYEYYRDKLLSFKRTDNR